ncbi:MAG: putative heme utilization carrier protein HutX [Motiliproteus sp.]|jgi:putative heme utilization carrier protein HutX
MIRRFTDRTELHKALPGSSAEALMRELSRWGNTTTIILHGNCVFEFKGNFPDGSIAEDYYNLEGPASCLHGHINLKAIDHICFQDRPHRGRESYAFNFQDDNDNNIFKVFLGRDEQGTLLVEQVTAFKRIQLELVI